MFYYKKYKQRIRQLPVKEAYLKEDLMVEEFLYAKEGNIEIYWAPFEYINKDAKVIILGITPGWTQMQLAFNYVRKNIGGLEEQETMLRNAKKQASFGGNGIRKNLIEMLDGIELNKHLDIKSCKDLYEEYNHLLHSSSSIRYPVFINKKNYNGSTPSMLKQPLLLQIIHNLLIPELNEVEDAIIIPAGKAVSEVLRYLVGAGLIDTTKTILYDFPHPSGANGHRKKQYEQMKDLYKKIVKNHFD